jgi:hypothetical protein
VADYFRLERQLSSNRRNGIFNFLFQCDAKGHFPYLKPYQDALKCCKNVDIYMTGANLDGEVQAYLRQNGVKQDRIIEHNSLVRLTEWDTYMSPTSWGNIFPKNDDCPRIQIFHTMADKNIQYGENLAKFNTIFVCGPIHHEFLEKYLFGPFPGTREKVATFNVGYAKIDALINGEYNHAQLKKMLKIPEDDKRKIILYAPNWEKTSALNRYKEDVFDVMKGEDYLLLVKLHYMSLLPKDKLKSDDHVDWKALLDGYSNVENFRIVYDNSIDPYLSLSDLMVTDYGGAAFEFMCTGKPIVYLDCPEFFEMRGKEIMEYWSRESGYLVSDVQQLPDTIATALIGDDTKARLQAEMIDRLLYNPGKAAEAGLRVIFEELLS